MATARKRCRLAALVGFAILCAGAAAEAPMPSDARSLADLLRPGIRQGWKITVEEDRVIMERTEPVELYNSTALPGGDTDAEIRRRVFRQQIRITMWLGEHLTAEEFRHVQRKNRAAVDQVREDQGAKKFMPDADFWQKHPEYGYRQLPILEAGAKSIYMTSSLDCIARPLAKPRQGGHCLMAFFNSKVGQECQGAVDELTKLFRPYPD